MIISIIVAKSINNVIGKNNKLLWHLPDDLNNFKKLTTNHHVIMGRKTFESIGKPLPNRTNVIITKDIHYEAEGCIIVYSINDAIEYCKLNNETEAFVIGGGATYEQFFDMATKFYITEVKCKIDGDTYFPLIDNSKYNQIEKIEYYKNEKHLFDFDIMTLELKK